METLEEAIQKYGEILQKEAELAQEKDRLRQVIRDRLAEAKQDHYRGPEGVAQIMSRFTLCPRPEPLLKILTAEELLPFASFASKKVSELLVPRHGRDALLECFDVRRTEVLVIRRERSRLAPEKIHLS